MEKLLFNFTPIIVTFLYLQVLLMAFSLSFNDIRKFWVKLCYLGMLYMIINVLFAVNFS